jgi:transketolase
MFAIMNGMALHGGLVPFGGTFHMFSDYAKSALRMAALMKQRAIAVLTHDSIGQGEDGPTHQPIENTAGLRLIPNMDVWRPGNSTETPAYYLYTRGLREFQISYGATMGLMYLILAILTLTILGQIFARVSKPRGL